MTSKDGRQAIATAASKSVDLVLMNISMPGMNGIEVARALRAEAKTMRAQQALRDVMELGPEALSLAALIGMLGDEIDQLRRLGKPDVEIVGLIGGAIGRAIPVSAIAPR